MNIIIMSIITVPTLFVGITNGLICVFCHIYIYIYKTTFELIVYAFFCSLTDPVNAVKQTMSQTSLEINPISEFIIIKLYIKSFLVRLKP